ncbi:MAG: T9SS type A sorting domain-containing protein [Flavobacteriaceae bacterium]|nr:T9SS type A sorting domain-containing protein [Flavobacteriaceae bacterium]
MSIKSALLIFGITSVLCPQILAQNIKISNVININEQYPNEPSIMMDPNNQNIMVVGSNLNYYYRSTDYGETWVGNTLTSSYGVWGDPVIDVDNLGNFYFFHLSNTPLSVWLDRIICQKSTDKGNSWSDGTFIGLNGTKNQDKPWSVIDQNNNNIYLTWTQFDEYRSSDPLDISIILFSKSLDGGSTWSTPLRINKFAGDSKDDDDTVEGAVPAIGPNGEIYVSWAGPNGLVFNRSFDQGDTWLQEEIFINSMPGGWNYNIPGISRANGFPIIKCDLSGGVNHGTIYVNWSDQRNGINDTDIWLSKSIDGGDTWSSPSKVNNDNSSTHQFFTWMDIDQTNGNLHFVFYDRRNYEDVRTDVFLAYSGDGGETFTNRKISESPFLPTSDIFFGDYNNITAHNNIVRPVWTRLHNGQLSIWTDITPFDSSLSVSDEIASIEQNIKQYPNPVFNNTSYVSFKLHESSIVKLEIFDQLGRLLKTLINNDEMGYGKHIISINLDELDLQSGIYYQKLSINGNSKTLKTILK